MFKKGPEYLDCNEYRSSCTRKGADPFTGCLTCEYTIQRQAFVDKTIEKLEDYRGVSWKGQDRWPFEDVLSSVIDISTIATSRKDTDPTWTVVVSILVSIYRSEDAKIRAAENYRPEETSNKKGPAIKDTPSKNPYAVAAPKQVKRTSSLGPKLVDADDGDEDYG